jgi:hypothetical protein
MPLKITVFYPPFLLTEADSPFVSSPGSHEQFPHMLPYVTTEFSESTHFNPEDGSNMSFRNVWSIYKNTQRYNLEDRKINTQILIQRSRCLVSTQLNPEDGNNMSFRNVCIYLQEHSVTTQET